MMVELVGYIGSILVLINLYYLIRLRKSDRNYDFIEGKPGESLVQYMINFYHTDIQKYFPIFKEKQPECDTAYVICKDAAPAGLFLGNKRGKGELEVWEIISIPN